MKQCTFNKECKREGIKELDGRLLCEFHYGILKYEKDYRKSQKKPKKGILSWFFEEAPDHQFYVKGVGMARQKQSNLHAILFNLAFILFWIVIPIYLLLAIIFKWD